MTAIATALDYAAKGYAVFPCMERGKTPATGRGFKDATTNPATIRRWWSGVHNYNIGIATGQISGIWVLDLDGEHGDQAMADLVAKYGPLPPTAEVRTGRGGHMWFRCNGPIPSSVERIGPSIDVRADGGYVVAPPSIHPMGCAYEWEKNLAPAVAPEWLVKLAKQRPGAPRIELTQVRVNSHEPARIGAYGQAALDRECEALANTAQGGRNHALNRASFCLHRLVAGGELDGAEVRHRLIAAATANGLMTDPTDGPSSVERTIASGARAGLQHPRSRAAR